MGGYVETGAERSGANEPVRSLRDAVKPKLYAYDRYNDMYLYLRRVKPIFYACVNRWLSWKCVCAVAPFTYLTLTYLARSAMCACALYA